MAVISFMMQAPDLKHIALLDLLVKLPLDVQEQKKSIVKGEAISDLMRNIVL